MKSRVTVVAIILGLTLGLSGCAEDMIKMSAALEEFNTGVKSGGTRGSAMAVQPEAEQSKPTQLVVPSDKKVAAAMNEALPNIKKVMGVHRCIKDYESLRLLNVYAIPGNDMSRGYMGNYPDYEGHMKFHDRNKCVSVSVIDQFLMPALNALRLRVVYFADDSGETINFLYLFKKTDSGEWKLAQFNLE